MECSVFSDDRSQLQMKEKRKEYINIKEEVIDQEKNFAICNLFTIDGIAKIEKQLESEEDCQDSTNIISKVNEDMHDYEKNKVNDGSLVFEVESMASLLTTEERVEIIFINAKPGNTFRSTANEFNRRHPDRQPIGHGTVGKLVQRFKETGSVGDRPKSGRPKSATDANTSQTVIEHLIKSPKKSLRNLNYEAGINVSSTRRILKGNIFHPYKVQFVQQLHGEDKDRRVEFCEWLSNRMDLIKWIMFSGEAQFHLNGHVNGHNVGYGSDENPHSYEEGLCQNNPRVMVWAAILDDKLIGPYFFNENVTSETYLQMLQEFLFLIIEEMPLHERRNLWFQQDAAHPHNALAVRNYLDNLFPNKWIGRRGVVEWPPRSPDLTPLDFFLWGHLKSVVFVDRLRTIEDLKAKIRLELQRISAETIRSVQRSCQLRVIKCLEVEGEQFEHLY